MSKRKAADAEQPGEPTGGEDVDPVTGTPSDQPPETNEAATPAVTNGLLDPAEIYRHVLVRYVGPNMAVLGDRVILQGETREVTMHELVQAAETRPDDFEIIDPDTLDAQG